MFLGLALVLKTSMWAKRRYVRFKRWQPKAGRWTDWALRRGSAKRREAIKARISRQHSVRGQNRTVAPLTPEQISEKYADRRRTGKTRRESELRGRAAVAV